MHSSGVCGVPRGPGSTRVDTMLLQPTQEDKHMVADGRAHALPQLEAMSCERNKYNTGADNTHRTNGFVPNWKGQLEYGSIWHRLAQTHADLADDDSHGEPVRVANLDEMDTYAR